MIYALKQCGTSRPSAFVRRTDLPNARFPARLDSAESATTPCGAVVGVILTKSLSLEPRKVAMPHVWSPQQLPGTYELQRCRRRKESAHTADVAQAALQLDT